MRSMHYKRFGRHGKPKIVDTDQGSQFAAHEFLKPSRIMDATSAWTGAGPRCYKFTQKRPAGLCPPGRGGWRTSFARYAMRYVVVNIAGE